MLGFMGRELSADDARRVEDLFLQQRNDILTPQRVPTSASVAYVARASSLRYIAVPVHQQAKQSQASSKRQVDTSKLCD